MYHAGEILLSKMYIFCYNLYVWERVTLYSLTEYHTKPDLKYSSSDKHTGFKRSVSIENKWCKYFKKVFG